MQSSKTDRKTSSVASAVWHVAPSCWNQMLPIFSSSIFVNKNSFNMAVDCNGLSLFIFEEKWFNYAFGPKSAPNSDSFWVHRLFNVCVRIFCTPNATILLVYIAAKIKMRFILKDDFFLPNPASVGRSVAILSSVVQVCTQQYSFGGRIKLIICLIRHELSVTNHEISTIWKKR